VKTKSGITKLYFSELPKEVQERFRYDPAQAGQFNASSVWPFPKQKGRKPMRRLSAS
jgi:hypothetical protein